MAEFTLESDSITLPKGAWAKTHRERLRYGNQTILGLTQGAFRPYVYPLFTPAGFCVTSESPADHPHHSSLWIGSEHVQEQMPAASGAFEEYTYNFYVNETFQGRAPGRMIETGRQGRTLPDGSFEIVQEIEWRGPREWGADGGRIVALERRTMIVTAGERHNKIDLISQLTAYD